ncbi:MAG TPA: hypothetical protein VNG33_04530, partial [Polyangiaceae bacterium]|nr:hypothetical protein [Polyangiaceae bacterium]
EYASIKASAQAELDFFGNQPTTSENAFFTNGPIRMRHYFLKLETPIVDVLAGQYHDLFAWGGGFFPNTVAFLGIPGEIYHRNPQARITKVLKTSAVTVEAAVAAVRPVQRTSEVPDGQGGLKLSINDWKGVRAQGSGQAEIVPLAIGVSGVVRHFKVNPFSIIPGDYNQTNGWGLAVDALLPVVPGTVDDMSNTLTLTGEFTTGKGISDLYSGLSGGAKFPQLPNPLLLIPPPAYVPNIDQGIVTYDADGQLRAIAWQAFVVGLQYHLPIGAGKKLWVSGTFTQHRSNNILKLTPEAGKGAIYTKGMYFDGNVFFGITPATQLDLSYQVTRQTYGDGVTGMNQRAEVAMHYFF